MQIRTRVSPRNPQTSYQQLRRGEFGYIASLWRTLTSIQRNTFIVAAGSSPEALRLFIQANVNLSLIEEALISSYTATGTPAAFPLNSDALGAGVLEVSAASALLVVPTDYSLLIQATFEKGVTKLFTNPSQFSPIVTFPTGTDLTGSIDIGSDWEALYGVMSNDKRMCIKSCLINTTNGDRGPESIQCANEPVVASNRIIDSDGTFIINDDGTFIIYP